MMTLLRICLVCFATCILLLAFYIHFLQPTPVGRHWPASPAEQYGVQDGTPMRCFDGTGPVIKLWLARRDNVCYEVDEPKQ